MTSMSKTLFAAAALLCTAGVASADNTFEAKFTYTPSDPIEVIYEGFEATAKSACKIDLRKAGTLAVKVAVESKCRDQLMESAVAATERRALIAYHQQRTSPELTQPLQIAEVK